jgi:hypothetical protein
MPNQAQIRMKKLSTFGSIMYTRSYVTYLKYRYGFNTQEKGNGIARVTPSKGFDGQVCLSSI